MDQASAPCHCLLCQDPLDESAWDLRDRRIAENVREHGWHVMGVYGGPTDDWAYSIGLWHTLRSPEVCVVGLRHQLAMRLVNVIGRQVRDGRPLRLDERRDDVIENHPVVIRRVHPSWYPVMFGAGLDFAERAPWPMVQAVLPDFEGRFPWEDGVEDWFRTLQPMLWLDRADHPAGPWTEESMGDWPFRPTMPFHSVFTTEAVLDGEPVGMVARDPEGTWHFVAADAAGPGDVEVSLGRLVGLHKDVVQVAGLEPGNWVRRLPDGTWPV